MSQRLCLSLPCLTGRDRGMDKAISHEGDSWEAQSQEVVMGVGWVLEEWRLRDWTPRHGPLEVNKNLGCPVWLCSGPGLTAESLRHPLLAPPALLWESPQHAPLNHNPTFLRGSGEESGQQDTPSYTRPSRLHMKESYRCTPSLKYSWGDGLSESGTHINLLALRFREFKFLVMKKFWQIK